MTRPFSTRRPRAAVNKSPDHLASAYPADDDAPPTGPVLHIAPAVSASRSTVPHPFATPEPAPAAAPPRAKKLLAGVSKTRSRKPLRIVLHGVPKVGKSTWCAGAPNPIFLPFDDGIDELEVAKFDSPETFPAAKAIVQRLLAEEHDFETLVLDPISFLDAQIQREVCRRNGWETIKSPGYNTGEQAAVDEWRTFLALLDRLRGERGMHVILVAHTHVATVKNPLGDDYDKQLPLVEKQVAGLLLGWADMTLFAEHQIATKRSGKGSRPKAFASGLRRLRTTTAGGYEAGNRISLPDPMPLDATAFWREVEVSRGSATEFVSKARALAIELGGTAPERAEIEIERIGSDPRRLLELCRRIQVSIDQLHAPEEETEQ